MGFGDEYKPQYKRNPRRLGPVAASFAHRQRPGKGGLISLGVPGSGLSDASMKHIADCVSDSRWNKIAATENEVRQLKQRQLEHQHFNIKKRAQGRHVSIDSGLR